MLVIYKNFIKKVYFVKEKGASTEPRLNKSMLFRLAILKEGGLTFDQVIDWIRERFDFYRNMDLIGTLF